VKSELTVAASPLPRMQNRNSMNWCQCCHVLIQKWYLLAIATTFMRNREISTNLRKP